MKAYKRNRGSLPSFREVLRSSGVVTLAFLAAFLVGCSDDTLPPVGPSGVTNGTLPPPPPPPSAVISVEVLDFGGLATGQGNLFFVEFKMTESAGVGANINFVRLEVFRATGELEERQEIGAGQILAESGSNRLEASQTREESVLFGFRATVKKGRTLRLTIGFTDDQGNNHDIVEEWIFN